MKTIDEFLSELRSKDVNLWVQGDRLRYKAPPQTLTPNLLQELKERKPEILAFLNQVNAAVNSKLTSILPAPQETNLPLSFAQTRLWFFNQLEPDSSAYNMPTAYRLTGVIHVTALEQSLNEIWQRHSILRTVFPSVDGKPSQVILKDVNFTLSLIDLENIPETERLAQAQYLATQETQQPFDLAHGPLFRAKLLCLTTTEHVLLLTMHHIVYDGWSDSIFFQELATLYSAFCAGQPSPLKKLPIQYADFAVWQRQYLQGEVLESQLSYWKQQLGSSFPLLQLPTDYPRPAVQTYRGASQSLELSNNLVIALKSLSQSSGATLFMTMLAAFKILLYRYSGQENIIVGTPIAGRQHIETEGLIGLFLNSLALCTDLSAIPTFRQLLSRVREVTLGAYAHQDLPFEKLVEEIQPERSLSHAPIFQVWFNMLNFTDSKLELSGLQVDTISITGNTSKFDLTLYVREHEKGIYLQLVYSTDIFTPERIAEILTQYEHLLVQISESPDEKITNFFLVTPKAKLLLPAPNEILMPQWSGAVHTHFTQQARQVPQDLAVVDARVAWNYAELEERTNQLANYLLENGIGKGEVVAIYGQRSAWLVLAIIGVLKAGATFLILDPAYPTSRLLDCLNLASPRGWLEIADAGEIPNALKEFVSNLSCCFYLQLSQSLLLTSYSTKNPEVEIDPDDLAYLAFTSGSTGKPQGIIGTHRPLSHFIEWHCQTFGLNQSDRFSLLSGLSHDPLLRDIFTPLWLGATLCIPQQQHIETPGRLAVWMQQQKVSIAHLTPAMGQLLIESTSTITQLPQLRYVFFGGDSLTRYDVTKIKSIASTATCVNFYGATETPQAMGYFIIPNPEDKLKGQSTSIKDTIPLGKGIEDVQLLIINPTQQLAGIGEIGEIYVRTPYLSKGYLADDLLTQERFIINPFTNINGDRLYKTGDLARYLPDGNIEFLGRRDDQIKIRGYRIQLAEIESKLSQHYAVQESLVTATFDITGDKRLVAYIIPSKNQSPTTNELQSFLKQKLPEYMLPRAFVRLDALPLTPNGKIDYKALPIPTHSRQESAATFVAPRNKLEFHLTKIWENVLGIQPISIKDNFFDLGGHSLLAVRLFAEIEKAFNKHFPLSTLFQKPTIEELASILHQEQRLVPESLVLAIQPNGSKLPLYLINALGTGMFAYSNLARYLGSEQPVYGIQALGLDGQQPPHTTIEDMAKEYIKAIRILQPQDPYLLGGLSSGGVVAFEMARQLQDQGHRVALVALIDSYSPKSLQSKNNSISKNSSFLQKYKHNILRRETSLLLSDIIIFLSTSQFSAQEKLSYVIETMKKVWEKIENKLDTILYKLYHPNRDFLPYTARQALVKEAARQAIINYNPQIYQNKVTLFRASETPNEYHLGWQDLATGGLEIHEVPGDHRTIIAEPNIRILAENLNSCIEQTQAETLETNSSKPQKLTIEVENLTNHNTQANSSVICPSLIAIQTSGLKPPLFCIHALGTSVLYYRDLARHLGKEQPFYALQPQGLDGKYAPFTRIEDMASHYIKEIQTIQSEGPYFLGGSSFGGWVAWEIAQQLHRQGHEIALLALFDTKGLGYLKRMSGKKRLWNHLNKLQEYGANYILQKAIGKVQWLKNRLQATSHKYFLKFSLENLEFLSPNDFKVIVEEANRQAARNYSLKVYEGKVTLFRAIDHPQPQGWYIDPKKGWGELARGGLEIHDVPGNHDSMFRQPHVQILAEKLQTCLEKAQTND
ncbi:amino acid adenylation (plasmid) [Cylindrospermum sp. NIES-4074]|nr:amino acid adenylation [Cylindrospermum sp. NIES-4074]